MALWNAIQYSCNRKRKHKRQNWNRFMNLTLQFVILTSHIKFIFVVFVSFSARDKIDGRNNKVSCRWCIESDIIFDTFSWLWIRHIFTQTRTLNWWWWANRQTSNANWKENPLNFNSNKGKQQWERHEVLNFSKTIFGWKQSSVSANTHTCWMHLLL